MVELNERKININETEGLTTSDFDKLSIDKRDNRERDGFLFSSKAEKFLKVGIAIAATVGVFSFMQPSTVHADEFNPSEEIIETTNVEAPVDDASETISENTSVTEEKKTWGDASIVDGAKGETIEEHIDPVIPPTPEPDIPKPTPEPDPTPEPEPEPEYHEENINISEPKATPTICENGACTLLGPLEYNILDFTNKCDLKDFVVSNEKCIDGEIVPIEYTYKYNENIKLSYEEYDKLIEKGYFEADYYWLETDRDVTLSIAEHAAYYKDYLDSLTESKETVSIDETLQNAEISADVDLDNYTIYIGAAAGAAALASAVYLVSKKKKEKNESSSEKVSLSSKTPLNSELKEDNSNVFDY